MGLSITREAFTDGDFRQFSQRLTDSVDILHDLLDDPDFGQGALTLGAELESYIADQHGHVLPLNTTLVNELGDPQLQLELNRYNIEYNLLPVAVKGKPFSDLEHQLSSALGRLNGAAEKHQATVIPIGILPTLTLDNLDASAMTDLPRYRVLDKALQQLRGGKFDIDIHGQESVHLQSGEVVLEGANTSFQVHMRVEPQRFADTYNTIQFVTPLVLALCANSPMLLQKLLWEETRIALFKQSVDCRWRSEHEWRQPARVAYGLGWLRNNAWELFAETVALHKPIVPVLAPQDPAHDVTETHVPKLQELCLHMGSVWPWNRAVYDSSCNGHLRIEMRALPAGPSAVDMAANVALYVGLALGLRDRINDFLPCLPFHYVEYNFYRAAQHGLDARMLWSKPGTNHVEEVPLMNVLEMLLPYAQEGLKQAGVHCKEREYYLGIIERRFAAGVNGSRWQRGALTHFERKGNREEACRQMLERYMAEQLSGKPVTDWERLH